MLNNYYIADDGSIHRGQAPSRSRNSAQNSTSQSTICPMENLSVSILEVSLGRKICFWFVTMIMSLVIAYASYCVIYSGDSGGSGASWIWGIATIIGPTTGCILYGIFLAKMMDYNLWTYVLSAISTLGGILLVAAVAYIIRLVVMICLFVLMVLFYALLIIIVGGIIIAIIAGGF